MGLLSLAIWTPIVFGVVLLALGRDEQASAVRWVALIGAIISFALTLPLYAGFQLGTAEMQFVENAMWIERFNVNYHLGVDGISFWFVLLTAFINVVVVIAGWEVITHKVSQYMASFLISAFFTRSISQTIRAEPPCGWAKVPSATVSSSLFQTTEPPAARKLRCMASAFFAGRPWMMSKSRIAVMGCTPSAWASMRSEKICSFVLPANRPLTASLAERPSS